MPVVYPNLAGANPGTRVELYAFNHDTVKWYIYGYGRVSNDGRSIVPEVNPATGKQYGLLDFSWHFPAVGSGGGPGGDGPPCNDSCCGGGGGRAWMEEKIGKRVNQARVSEALNTGAEVLAAACPFCITMFDDGIKGVEAEDKMQIEDISEIVVRAMESI